MSDFHKESAADLHAELASRVSYGDRGVAVVRCEPDDRVRNRFSLGVGRAARENRGGGKKQD